MKYEAHIPTEMYGYLGFSDFEGTAEEAWAKYHEIKQVVQVQPKGLEDGDFRELFNMVVEGKPIEGDPGMPGLSPQQRFAINEAKKYYKRNK